MSETEIPAWVELHWQCAAAMLEEGVMDESGEWIADLATWDRCLSRTGSCRENRTFGDDHLAHDEKQM